MGSEAKSNAVYAMVKGMVERGIPIDGVGFQVHVAHTYAQFDGVAANMERLARLGLQIHLTELDVTCEATHCTLEEQASVYRSMLRVCLREPACTSFETWGFTGIRDPPRRCHVSPLPPFLILGPPPWRLDRPVHVEGLRRAAVAV